MNVPLLAEILQRIHPNISSLGKPNFGTRRYAPLLGFVWVAYNETDNVLTMVPGRASRMGGFIHF